MERLKLKFKDAQKALETFGSVLEEPYSVIVRDELSSGLNILLKQCGSS